MKRIISFLLALTILAPLLAGCQPNELPDSNSELTTAQLMEAVLASCQDDLDNLERLDCETDPDFLATYLSEVYQFSGKNWSDCALARLGGASAFEIAIIQLTDEADPEQAMDELGGYLTRREGDFTGYEPEQAEMVSRGLCAWQRTFVALFICEDPDAARNAFYACFDADAQPIVPSAGPISTLPVSPEVPLAPPTQAPSAFPTQAPSAFPTQAPSPELTPVPEPTPTSTPRTATYPGRTAYVQPNIDDMTLYNTTAIQAAWASGDPSALSSYDRAIYDRCAKIIPTIIQDGMTDLQKEQAIYLWVVGHISYDNDHYSAFADMDPASYTPYGGLVNHKGVCLGYASTFQLLMDLAGVECITVVGAAYYSREDHAWNMVRLNGKWYCVDSTWDAGSTNPRQWSYFNVTSDYMARTNHQWDYNAIPEATATDGGRG